MGVACRGSGVGAAVPTAQHRGRARTDDDVARNVSPDAIAQDTFLGPGEFGRDHLMVGSSSKAAVVKVAVARRLVALAGCAKRFARAAGAGAIRPAATARMHNVVCVWSERQVVR